MTRRFVAVGVVLILAAFAFPVRAGFEASHSFDSEKLVVRNLIGEIRVSGHDGAGFEVRVSVQGDDASPELVRIEEKHGALNVVFPVDENRRFVYPELGAGSKTSFTASEEGQSGWLGSVLKGIFGGDRITVSGRGRGLEVWADVEVLVPRGGRLTVKHGVGRIHAGEVDGDLVLDNNAGSVEISGARGDVNVDTGSGGVTASDVAGELVIDTGSGGVVVERVSGRYLNVDTGSGSVRAQAVAVDSATIDTGSGSVTLELDRMGSGDFDVDTGSGGITLAFPSGASAEVYASTGSGGIHLDLEGVELRRKERNEVAFTVGGGGGARVRLDTGSGGIRIVSN